MMMMRGSLALLPVLLIAASLAKHLPHARIGPRDRKEFLGRLVLLPRRWIDGHDPGDRASPIGEFDFLTALDDAHHLSRAVPEVSYGDYVHASNVEPTSDIVTSMLSACRARRTTRTQGR